MSDCYRMINAKARRDHRCYECRGIIKRGEYYHYHSGIWDGSPASYKTCHDCDCLRDYIEEGLTYDDERVGFGDLIASLSDYDNRMELYYMYAEIKIKRGGTINKHILEEIIEDEPLYGHCLEHLLTENT